MMKKIDNISIFTDGGSRGNPGEAASAFIIYDDDNNIVYKEGKRIGQGTNNEAEYKAVIFALKWISENLEVSNNINFFLDSELVASQLSGKYKVKSENIRNYFFSARLLEDKVSPPHSEPKTKIIYTAIRREQNKEADKLVNLALDNKI
ncbi:reverse transcriptase-like protein [Candidatus Parcubacteria bacterium]|nr:MAG: reverse transcriptase-like protein [Candidatus Parcubacteria bacterium]